MQILNRCDLEAVIPDEYRDDFRLAKGIVKGKLPGAHHYLITSFFFPTLRKARTSLYPPILRAEILAAQTSVGDHVLVYQTSSSDDELLDIIGYGSKPAAIEKTLRSHLR